MRAQHAVSPKAKDKNERAQRAALRDSAEGREQEGAEAEGIVIEALPNAMFRVRLADGRCVTCHMSTELRRHTVQVLPGDTVVVMASRLDSSRGRITGRARDK